LAISVPIGLVSLITSGLLLRGMLKTAFDFDDSAYCWFMVDLADAWRNGVGWTMFEPDVARRREFMKRYFETLLDGYSKEHTFSNCREMGMGKAGRCARLGA
jgi:Ser/Thr protein kinase RdoA (MazF antagonist)